MTSAARERPAVSIVVPCRDAEAHLAAALRSARDQTAPPLEILVVDNGSTDGGPAVAESFGPPVRLLRAPEPGASRARIVGAAEAVGDAIMFLDADDLLAPTALEGLIAALRANPEAVAICPWRRLEALHAGLPGAAACAADGGSAAFADRAWVAAPASCAPRDPRRDPLSNWLRGWWAPPCAVLWSRAAYLRSGGWDPALANNQDGDLMMRAFLAGVPAAFAITGEAFYRRAPGGGSLSGARFTEAGAAARAAVLGRVEAALRESGRLDAFAADLAEAYRREAAACAGQTAARACADAANRLSGPARNPAAPPPSQAPRLTARLGDRPGAPLNAAPPGGASPAPAPAGPPLVSVVIPAFNRAGLLMERSLPSVLAEDYPALEAIVVDDASTDDTAARVAALGDARVRLVRQTRNGGVARARNAGMDAARGAYIAFLDSDDAWLPGSLAPRVAALEAAPPRVALVWGGVETLRPDGAVETTPARAAGALFRAMLAHNVAPPMFSSNGLMRRAVVETIGGFDPSLPAIEDWEYAIRAARFFEFAAIERPLSRYHDEETADEAGLRRSRNHVANMAAREMLRRRYGADMREQGVEIAFLLDSARRRLSTGFRERPAAMRDVLRALRRSPASPALYAWLASCVMPGGLGAWVRRHAPIPAG